MAQGNSSDVATGGGGLRASRKGAYMVKSMQRADLGDKRFTELQEEVREASETALQDFQAAIDPDAMGPDGKEGISDAD